MTDFITGALILEKDYTAIDTSTGTGEPKRKKPRPNRSKRMESSIAYLNPYLLRMNKPSSGGNIVKISRTPSITPKRSMLPPAR